MTNYQNYGVTLSKRQIINLKKAADSGSEITIRISKENLHGNMMLPLTETQINKIRKAGSASSGVQLKLSISQLSHMEKNGGFLPLLTLIPLIAGAVGAAGGLTGGIASAVSAAKSNAEQARHNREVENLLKTESPALSTAGSALSTGTGIISDTINPIPIVGKPLSNALKKFGLGGCVKNLKGVKWGNGLYLERQGEGLFLARPGEGR